MGRILLGSAGGLVLSMGFAVETSMKASCFEVVARVGLSSQDSSKDPGSFERLVRQLNEGKINRQEWLHSVVQLADGRFRRLWFAGFFSAVTNFMAWKSLPKENIPEALTLNLEKYRNELLEIQREARRLQEFRKQLQFVLEEEASANLRRAIDLSLRLKDQEAFNRILARLYRLEQVLRFDPSFEDRSDFPPHLRGLQFQQALQSVYWYQYHLRLYASSREVSGQTIRSLFHVGEGEDPKGAEHGDRSPLDPAFLWSLLEGEAVEPLKAFLTH